MMSYSHSHAGRVRGRQQPGYLSFSAIACFLMPLMTIPKINVVGVLMLSDVFAILLVPVILLNGRFHLHQPYLRSIILLLLAWLFGAIASDVYNQTAFSDVLRGNAKIIFFGASLTTLLILLDGQLVRFNMLLLGAGLSLILAWVTGGGETYQKGPFFGIAWKFGNGLGVTILFCLLTEHLRGKSTMLASFSLLHLILNARSLFLNTFLAGAMGMISMRVRQARSRMIIAIVLFVLAVGILPVAMSTYGELAASGTLGEAQRDKYLRQTAGDVSILIGGRPELLISLKAIGDRPLLGHGSWAKSLEYNTQLFAIQQSLGMNVRLQGIYKNLRIPSHSHLFGSWVEHGVFGAAFWMFVLWLGVRALYAGVLGNRRARPVEIFLITFMLWTVLFSPFGLSSRVYDAIGISIICNVLHRASQLGATNFREVRAEA